jgi:hypothetical protein
MNITRTKIESAIALAREIVQEKSDFKSETFLGVLLVSLLDGRSPPVLTDSQKQPAISIAKGQSIGELFAEKNPESDLQRVLIAGYFLEKLENQAAFNVDDLSRCFLQAKERLPSNMNDAVNKNISKGLIMEAKEKKDGKKAWMLTRTGEAQVGRGQE